MKRLYVVTYLDQTWHTREKYDTSQETMEDAKRLLKDFDKEEKPLIEVYERTEIIGPFKGNKK